MDMDSREMDTRVKGIDEQDMRGEDGINRTGVLKRQSEWSDEK